MYLKFNQVNCVTNWVRNWLRHNTTFIPKSLTCVFLLNLYVSIQQISSRIFYWMVLSTEDLWTNIWNCYINPQQFKVFVDQIKQVCTLNECHGASLNLQHFEMSPTVRFRYERVHALCGLIRDTHLVSRFNIAANFIHSQASIDYHATLKSIIVHLAINWSSIF